MNANQIIKELLARLYVSSIRYAESDLWTSPLTESYAMSCPPGPEGLELALGGEAKVLWDMVNESPYTPLETELLQRLQMVHNEIYDLSTGDGKCVYRACFAPTEEAWLEPLQMWFKDEPPWITPGGAENWNSYKDHF